VGRVLKNENETVLEIYPQYADALLGLEAFSHIVVLYWFHENDNSDDRKILQVHPRRNPQNPLTGVFATRSPVRPNLIALSTCKIESIQGSVIKIDDIDARDGTPVIDIKCYFPSRRRFSGLRTPDWIK
jgi:tRNA-Thr(GGU) m(6)t(6)A37 methyltransferase TsaA